MMYDFRGRVKPDNRSGKVCTKGGQQRLFDFRFLENHMLAYNRIIFPEFHLFSGITGVFLGDIVEPGIGGADQFDQDCIWLCHRYIPNRKSRCRQAAHHTAHMALVKVYGA